MAGKENDPTKETRLKPTPIFARSAELRAKLVVEMHKLAFDLYKCSADRAIEKIMDGQGDYRSKKASRLIHIYNFLRS